jgi:5-methyltetrahydrofolate corrinoid/iron sulfur protein methyltransferase
MLVIGNQIRMARGALAAAVDQRYGMLIQTLARRQVEAGATWLLVDMGPQRRNAADDLAWLVKTIQKEVNLPLVLRSDDPAALEAGLKASRDRTLIDATLPGVAALEPFIDLARQHGAALAFSACPEGLPTPTDERLALVTETLLPKALDAGLSLDHVYVDPLVTALTCDQPMVPATVETLRLLKIAADPAPKTLVHLDDITDGVSDAARPYISQAYLSMLLAAGLDALVANALDSDLMDVIRLVTGRDAVTPFDRLLLRLFDVTKAEVDLEPAFVDRSDEEQVKLYTTIQVLNNDLIYADSYLKA